MKVWAMIPEKVVVADMIVILKSLASQLEKMPRDEYITRMRIGKIPRDAGEIRGIEIYVGGDDSDPGQSG